MALLKEILSNAFILTGQVYELLTTQRKPGSGTGSLNSLFIRKWAPWSSSTFASVQTKVDTVRQHEIPRPVCVPVSGLPSSETTYMQWVQQHRCWVNLPTINTNQAVRFCCSIYEETWCRKLSHSCDVNALFIIKQWKHIFHFNRIPAAADWKALCGKFFFPQVIMQLCKPSFLIMHEKDFIHHTGLLLIWSNGITVKAISLL